MSQQNSELAAGILLRDARIVSQMDFVKRVIRLMAAALSVSANTHRRATDVMSWYIMIYSGLMSEINWDTAKIAGRICLSESGVTDGIIFH